MSNVHILKDIKDRGYQLGSTYEQELEKKLRTAIDFNSEIINFNEKLQAENLEYSERKEDIENKISQLNASSVKLVSKKNNKVDPPSSPMNDSSQKLSGIPQNSNYTKKNSRKERDRKGRKIQENTQKKQSKWSWMELKNGTISALCASLIIKKPLKVTQKLFESNRKVPGTDICKENKHPEINEQEIPKCYIDLMKRC
ncbi:hypothetical protein C1645_802165 [Glomus cerebriforme]|uniref:Uncharacterized protein n=1 Tax=Glomus cerebriforme TaxID=658196 RepID=A0A397TPL1_9GLOM|nr:hypothetical protein C1645_802165 [Glomus cerebriforme]